MRLKSSIFCLLAGFALTAFAEPEAPAFKAGPPQTMELKNAQWFDGKGFVVKRGTLYVKDGKFSAQKIKKPQRSLDLAGQFLIPPLAEAHNHNLQNAWGYGRFTNNYLRDGVFYAAMQCGEPKGAGAARGLANQPAAPDILFVTACITSSDGQPLAQLLADEAGGAKLKLEDVADKLVLIMDTPEQVAQKWPLVAPRKTDLVKLMLSRSDSPELRADPKQQGRLGLKPDVPPAIVKRAHKDGLRVIAHVDTAADFTLALQSGVDWIAHLPGYFFHEGLGAEAYRISPEMAAEAAKQRVAVVTGTAAATLFRASPETQAAIRRLQIENLHTLKAAGVKLLLGSDVFNGNALTELRHLDGLGVLDRPALLRLATISTPQTLYPKRRLACFEPGCEASFLLLTGNPLNDLDALGRIQLRVKQGRVLNLQSP